MKDMKEGLSSARKADTTHVRKSIKVYIARACEWGSAKYERGNYLRPASEHEPGSPEAVAADFMRQRSYLRAAQDHIADALDMMERHLALDPHLEDVEGMKRAAYAEDLDAKPGCPHGHSGLPHVAPAAASLMMAIEQATHYGLLPTDPGQPWAERKKWQEALTAASFDVSDADAPEADADWSDPPSGEYTIPAEVPPPEPPAPRSLDELAAEVAEEMEPVTIARPKSMRQLRRG